MRKGTESVPTVRIGLRVPVAIVLLLQTYRDQPSSTADFNG